MKYKDMLDRAYESVDKIRAESQRLQIPEPSSSFDGSYTEIENFRSISKSINRSSSELFTFFKRSFATSGSLEDESAMFKGKFSENDIKNELESYFEQYVVCQQCGSPDTEYEDRSGVEVIRCTACGADNPKP